MIAGSFETVEKADHARQGESVPDLLPALLIRDHTRFAEHTEMTRYGGPTEAGRLHQVANATFSLPQPPHHGDAGGMTEGFEDVGGRGRRGRSFNRHETIFVNFAK